MHKLAFTVHEYIKGHGSDNILVVVRHLYRWDGTLPRRTPLWVPVEEPAARNTANVELADRNTTWDDRQGLLFLIRDTDTRYYDLFHMSDVTTSYESDTVDDFVFPVYGGFRRSVWDYTVDTLHRVWLPAHSTTVPSDTNDIKFITNGAADPQPTSSLRDLRARKDALENSLREGADIEGYEACIHGKIARERLYDESTYEPVVLESTIASATIGAEVFRDSQDHNPNATDYYNFWLSDDDGALFHTARHDDDTDPKNGYDHTLETVRPLPAGTYSVRYNLQHYKYIPCDHKPTTAYVLLVTNAEAPPLTLHEAFFDPVSVGTTVAADETHGVLKPASFTDVMSVSAAINRIAWEPPATVKLEVNPHTSIMDHTVDFIAIDGSVPLSLRVADATTDAANNTLSWTVASQPWQDGDKLMLRIREVPNSSNGKS